MFSSYRAFIGSIAAPSLGGMFLFALGVNWFAVVLGVGFISLVLLYVELQFGRLDKH